MFIVIRKKNAAIAFLSVIAIIAVAAVGFTCSDYTFALKKATYKVVLDAGHGGPDPGVIGVDGTIEAELNLNIAVALQDVLSEAGMDVIMTRNNADIPSGDVTGRFKAKDFACRKKIILDADPDLVISVHANKFPQNPSRRGIQVFYNKTSEEGKVLAVSLQNALNRLNEKYVGKTFSALAGEYFMLNCVQKPSVIVECGFLSNVEDEKLLNTPSYRAEIVEEIYAGIADFLEK